MIPGQSERGKRRLKLVLVLVAVVLVSVILLGITLAGNSSSSEYDEETIQKEVQYEQQQQQQQLQKQQENRQQIENMTTINILELSNFVVETVPFFVMIAVLIGIIGVFVKVGRKFV